MFKDNRDLPIADLDKKSKYHPHVRKTVDAFAKFCPVPARVLDIGARDGYGVECLASLGYDAMGIELVPEYVDYAVKHGRRVVSGDALTATNAMKGQFDAVFSRHTIEHVRHPIIFLSNCAFMVKRGGIVFITFPLETTEEWRSRDKHDHLCHFASKDDFREAILSGAHLEEIVCTRSKHLGMDEVGKELCFVGRVTDGD